MFEAGTRARQGGSSKPVGETAGRPTATHPLTSLLPTWGPEPLAFSPGSGPGLWDPYLKALPALASRGSGKQAAKPHLHIADRPRRRRRALTGERGCLQMARVFAILTALASIFLVAGASARY